MIDPLKVTVEQFDLKRHSIRFAPLYCRYYREVNKEDLEQETSLIINGAPTVMKRIDLEMQAFLFQGMFCKVAIYDEEIVGFVLYRACYGHFVVPIDAMYVRREFRLAKVGQKLINSFITRENLGKFEIVAFIHENNRPEEMLGTFKSWEIVRSCNDRDLTMIRGFWDSTLHPTKEPVLKITRNKGGGNGSAILSKPELTEEFSA